MIYNAVDGSVFEANHEFLDDESDSPLVPKPGYPKVRLLDKDKNLLFSGLGVPDVTPGNWKASVAVPTIGNTDRLELIVEWRFWESNGQKTKVTEAVLVDPKTEPRVSNIVVLQGKSKFKFSLPIPYRQGVDEGFLQLYLNNSPVLNPPIDLGDSQAVEVVTLSDKASFKCGVPPVNPSLKPYLLDLTITRSSGEDVDFTYMWWLVTPQIVLATNALEEFLNKARIEEVIPSLQYVDGDLVHYLERGLYLFNTVGSTTAFTGTNMQGILYEAWLTCSCYYALCAQLIAEGSLAFDFSGQGVSLNVDRTPQLEAALGRIERHIADQIAPLKKKMVQQGFLTGDGSAGAGPLRNSMSIGRLGMINSPTTRVGGYGGGLFLGRRN
jgi:hypothetical protein